MLLVRGVLGADRSNGAIAVEVDESVRVPTGAVAEASGFPGTFFGTPVLSGSDVKEVSQGTVPEAAASIINPMIERPETAVPFLRTVTSDANCETVLTKRAAARACSPF